MSPSGAYTFNPNGEGDTQTFTYTISDGNGGSDLATVTIVVDPPSTEDAIIEAANIENSPPSAENDSYLLSNQDPTVRAFIIEPNDSDPESDKLTILTLDGDDVGSGGSVFEKTLPSGGVIKVNPLSGGIVYDGSAYVGGLGQDERFVETVPYSIGDGNGGTDMATITFIVPGKNDPPMPEDDSETVPEGEEVSDCILTNDSDPDGDRLEVCEVKFMDGTTFSFDTATELPGGGTLSISTDGCYVFSTADGDFESLGAGETAESCFKYWACDGFGGSAEAEVCIEITGIESPSGTPSGAPSVGPTTSYSPSAPPSQCQTDAECSDGIDCTVDVCDTGYFSNTANNTACNDGNPCTMDSCNVGSGCVFDASSMDNAPCDDSNAFTHGDVCESGVCAGTHIPSTVPSSEPSDPPTKEHSSLPSVQPSAGPSAVPSILPSTR